MSLSYFDSTAVADGTNVTSNIDLTALVSAIQSASPDTYFDSTDEIGYVYVYYDHTDGRQRKRIVHDPSTHLGTVQWSPNVWMGHGRKLVSGLTIRMAHLIFWIEPVLVVQRIYSTV